MLLSSLNKFVKSHLIVRLTLLAGSAGCALEPFIISRQEQV